MSDETHDWLNEIHEDDVADADRRAAKLVNYLGKLPALTDKPDCKIRWMEQHIVRIEYEVEKDLAKLDLDESARVKLKGMGMKAKTISWYTYQYKQLYGEAAFRKLTRPTQKSMDTVGNVLELKR